MGKDKQKLCKWGKRDLMKDLDKFKKIVRNPRYICLKCGRAAGDSDYLHKPEKLT